VDLHVVLMKRVFAKYKTLMVHMNKELNHVASTKTNLKYLCDIEVVIELMCVMQMLEIIHAFIKFVQPCDMFVCDFLMLLKICVVHNCTCIKIRKQSMFKKTSKHSSTSVDASYNGSLFAFLWTFGRMYSIQMTQTHYKIINLIKNIMD